MTTLEAEGAALLTGVREAPENRDRWVELGRWCTRTGRRPEGYSAPSHLPQLLQVWNAKPDDRALVPALMGLLGAVPEKAKVPAYWHENHRILQADDHFYVSTCGLPVTIRRLRDGARMHLVDKGMSRPGRDLLPQSLDPPPRRRTLGFHYMDESPVSAEQLATFRQVPPPNEAEDSVSVEGREARNFAAWAGGELPTELEWGHARTLGRILATEPVFLTPHLDGDDRRAMRKEWRERVAHLIDVDSTCGPRRPTTNSSKNWKAIASGCLRTPFLSG